MSYTYTDKISQYMNSVSVQQGFHPYAIHSVLLPQEFPQTRSPGIAANEPQSFRLTSAGGKSKLLMYSQVFKKEFLTNNGSAL
jgi:hypothetical protein